MCPNTGGQEKNKYFRKSSGRLVKIDYYTYGTIEAERGNRKIIIRAFHTKQAELGNWKFARTHFWEFNQNPRFKNPKFAASRSTQQNLERNK